LNAHSDNLVTRVTTTSKSLQNWLKDIDVLMIKGKFKFQKRQRQKRVETNLSLCFACVDEGKAEDVQKMTRTFQKTKTLRQDMAVMASMLATDLLKVVISLVIFRSQHKRLRVV
jgi:predicted glycosyltransferase